MAQPIVHLSTVLRSPLLDRAGERLGRVEDLIVRLADGGYPPITGLKARVGGRDLFVPADKIAQLGPGAVRLSGQRLSLGRFERREGEVLLRQDVLGRKLVNVKSEPPSLVTANEIELACIDGWWRVVGVDPSRAAELRRWLPAPLKARVGDRPFIDWTDLEPFVGHVPTSRLRFSFRKLADLHPAEIADLVEAASHDEGEEIIKAVGQDRELEADVFEELDEHHQMEFIGERSDEQIAQLVSRMATDDAADIVAELDQDRRGRVLSLLPGAQQRQIKALLGYNPSTAGGLMSPDILTISQDASVAAGLRRVAESTVPPGTLTTVYLVDQAGTLVGSVLIATLMRTSATTPASEVADHEPVSVQPDADLPEVARLMTDYNLVMLPVVDEHDKAIGVVTVDDVLELTLPTGWRRRYGLVRD